MNMNIVQTFVEYISRESSRHEYDHERQHVLHIASRLKQNDCQGNRHSRHPTEHSDDRAVIDEGLRAVLQLLWPITPHLSEHLWQALTGVAFMESQWPEVDDTALSRDELEIVVQVNGKVRGKINVPASADNAEIEAMAKSQENVQRFLADTTIRKVIVVPQKLVNIVAQ